MGKIWGWFNGEGLEEGETFPGENKLFDKLFDFVEDTVESCKATAEVIIDHLASGLQPDDRE